MKEKLKADEPNFDRKILIFLLSAIFVILACIWMRQEPIFVNVEGDCKSEEVEKIQRPRYVLYDGSKTVYIIYLVTAVLSRLNLERVFLEPDQKPEDLPQGSWDLLWTFPYQNWKINASKLNPYQKVNHWPGNVAFASKYYLGTQTDSKYIPKAFADNEKFKKFAAENPNKKFVAKLKTNRGVKLVNASEVEIPANTAASHMEGIMVQEFIENPLLWDGHKFDIAAYVALTSVDPLRLYYYDRHFHLRFVPKPYNISDPEDILSYVIDNDHHGGDKFLGVKKYLDKDFNYNDALEAFLESKGKTLEEIRLKIENLIREIILSKEHSIVNELARIKSSKWNYFELFRFDMIIDDNFNIFLLEVNMSPNIHGDKPPFQPLFENVIYSFFSLTGVATNYYKKYFGDFPPEYERMILVDRTVIAVNHEDCMKDKCNNTCEEECAVCWNCLVAKGWKREIIQSYEEQMNCGHFRRLFPPSQNFLKTTDENFMKNLTKSNELLTKWYTGMCKKNLRFC